MDQLLFAPWYNLLYFMTRGLLQGENPRKTRAKIRREYPRVMYMQYRVWPIVNFINFAFVPQQLRHSLFIYLYVYSYLFFFALIVSLRALRHNHSCCVVIVAG